MAYKYKSPVADPDNFINKYVAYASKLTDASHDYHEAVAIFLLSIVMQGVKLQLPNMPNGLRTNLFMILYGTSSYSRKSTSMDIGKDILQRACPGLQLPASFTPGGLEEELSNRSGQPSALFADEFSRIVDQMHNQSFMSGLRQFLLTMYSNENWEYKKISKGNKTKVADEVVISDSHLCLLGNVTPTITKYIQPRDIEDGFMARFAMIFPQDKPRRKKIGELETDTRGRGDLVLHLSQIRQICKKLAAERRHNPTFDQVIIEPEAIDALDGLQEEIESLKTDLETAMIMVERIGIMAFKLAMIVAMGRHDPTRMAFLRVEQEDAIAAIGIARKWFDWAQRFAGSLYESDIEKYLRRAMAWLNEHDGEMARWEIAKRMRLTKKMLDEVQLTLVDRGMISLGEKRLGDSHKPTLIWHLKDYE